MRVGRLTIIALLGLPLAGCSGVTLPPKPLPEWAMSPQAQATPRTRVKVARRVPARRTPDRTAAVSHVAPTTAQPANAPSDVKPFSPEWQAREDAFDNKLRRTMSI